MNQKNQLGRRDALMIIGATVLQASGCKPSVKHRSRFYDQFFDSAKYLSNALESEMHNYLVDAVRPLHVFFEGCKAGISVFASDVLSTEGKLAYLKGVYDPESHGRFLEKSFARNVFSPEDLKETIEFAIGTYVQRMSGKENELLEDLHQRIRSWSGKSPKIGSLSMDGPEFVRQYDIALTELKPVVAVDIGVAVGKVATSEFAQKITATIVSSIGGALATRMGISTGVLGTGTAASAASFGASLIAAIVIDLALEWIVKQTGYDPEAEVASRVALTLERIQNLVVEGEFPTDEPPSYDPVRDPIYDGVFKKTVDEEGRVSNQVVDFLLHDSYQKAKVRFNTERAARQKETDVRLANGPGLRYQLAKFNRIRSPVRLEALKQMLNSMT